MYASKHSVNRKSNNSKKNYRTFGQYDPFFTMFPNEPYCEHTPYEDLLKEEITNPLCNIVTSARFMLAISGYNTREIERIVTKGWYAYHWYDAVANDSFEHYISRVLSHRSIGLKLGGTITIILNDGAKTIERTGKYNDVDWAEFKMNSKRIKGIQRFKSTLSEAGYSPVERQLILNALCNAKEDGYVSKLFDINSIESAVDTIAKLKYDELYFYRKDNPSVFQKIKISKSLLYEANADIKRKKTKLVEPDWETIMRY